ncbi:MAG: pilus assembly FimT family protein [Gammaproteobacteria bacterium]
MTRTSGFNTHLTTSSFPRLVTPQRSAGGTRKSSAGFTLLELLIVLSIIAIATGLIVPNLSITDNAAFNADVRRAASALTYARRMAIVKGAPQSVTLYALDPDARDYEELLAEANSSDGSARWTSDDIALEYQTELAPDPERVDQIEITFFPQGGSTGGLLAFLRDERSALIRVNAITGRIETAYNGEELDDER